MKRLWLLTLLSLMSVFVVGCQLPGAPGAQVAELPTIASLPSITPSNTPTNTPTATASATDTPTPAASATDTPTATNTPTVTNTPPPTPTPTHTLTHTPTHTPTPIATNTPTVTPTSTQPSIIVYQSNITQGQPNDPVRLRWQVDAESARIERLNLAGSIEETIPVERIGAVTLTLPNNGEAQAIYRLVAVRGTNETASAIPITLGTICDPDWFFDPASSLGDIGCPAGDPANVTLVYQKLQRGFMFKLTTQNIDQVCAVDTTRNNLYACYPSASFAGPAPDTPPTGLLEPTAVLQNVFYNQIWLSGFIYQSLGWATETPFNNATTLQFSNDGFLYLQTPGGVYRFDDTLALDFTTAPRANQ